MVYGTSNVVEEWVTLGWYLNRLRSMGPAELAHRLLEAGRKRASQRRHEGWERYPAGPVPTLPVLREAVLRADPTMRANMRTATAELLAGRFAALGRTWPLRNPVDLFPAELWRLDPVTGTLWPGPETYTHAIDFRHDGARGDVKYVWEINRLQLLMPLAAEVALSGDAAALAAIEAAVASWHAANPPFRGIAWAAGIEVALRAISLIVTTTLTGERLSARSLEQVGQILTASAFWLERFPSKHSSANNHRIAELAGLYLIGLGRGEEPAAARQGLVTETLRQILPDGAGAEQTPSYAAFSAELALLCAVAARGAGLPFPAAFDTRLGAFGHFIAWLGGDAPPPALGDDDEGKVLTLLTQEEDYAGSVAGAIAGYLERPGPQRDDFRGLLLGRAPCPASRPDGLRTFPDGGLSVWHGWVNDREARITFDHGPLGYLAIAAHGHADALSLTLSLDGLPVLVDPGTYLYGPGGPWRRWFRSTPAHNTLNLEGVSQSRVSGPFNWSDKAMARLVASGADPAAWLLGEHDGYLRRHGRLVRRRLAIEPSGIMVTDQLIGGPPRAAEIVFQLAPGLSASRTDRRVTVSRGAQPVLQLDFPTDAVTLAAGEDRVDGGWVSRRFGERDPAWRLSWQGGVGEAGVTTRLTPLAGHVATALDTHPSQT